MTYNTGLFVAVVLGYALGALLMSHVPENYAAALAARQRATERSAAYEKLQAGNAATGNVASVAAAGGAEGAGLKSRSAADAGGGNSSNSSALGEGQQEDGAAGAAAAMTHGMCCPGPM